MTQKKVWIVVGVVVVALITIKVIATLSSRVPNVVEQPFAPENLLPVENVAPVPDVNQQLVPMEETTIPAEPASTAAQSPVTSTPVSTSVSTTPAVREIQTALKNAGFDIGSIDGKMGKKTKAAIIEFQRANGLTADGKVGPRTWSKLSKFLTITSSAQ